MVENAFGILVNRFHCIYTHYPGHHPDELCKEDLPSIWKTCAALYYKDYFLVVLLALVTPTVTSSGQTWVRTDPCLIMGSWTGSLLASPLPRNTAFTSTSTPPTLWQRHFLFYHWRRCLSPEDLPHKPCLLQHPSYTLTGTFPSSLLETMPSRYGLTS